MIIAGKKRRVYFAKSIEICEIIEWELDSNTDNLHSNIILSIYFRETSTNALSRCYLVFKKLNLHLFSSHQDAGGEDGYFRLQGKRKFPIKLTLLKPKQN